MASRGIRNNVQHRSEKTYKARSVTRKSVVMDRLKGAACVFSTKSNSPRTSANTAMIGLIVAPYLHPGFQQAARQGSERGDKRPTSSVLDCHLAERLTNHLPPATGAPTSRCSDQLNPRCRPYIRGDIYLANNAIWIRQLCKWPCRGHVPGTNTRPLRLHNAAVHVAHWLILTTAVPDV